MTIGNMLVWIAGGTIFMLAIGLLAVGFSGQAENLKPMMLGTLAIGLLFAIVMSIAIPIGNRYFT